MSVTVFRPSKFTLGVKLSLFVTILVLLVSASMAYFLVYQSATARRIATEKRFSSLARIIGGMRGQGVGGRQYDPMLVKMFVDFGVRMGTNLCFTVFTNANNEVVEGNINQKLLDLAAPMISSTMKGMEHLEQLKRIMQWQWTDESVRIFRVKLMGTDQKSLGLAVLGFSTKDAEREIKRSLAVNLVVTASAFLLGLLGALWLARHFSKPIRMVAKAMKRVSEGDLDVNLDVHSRDEIGVLEHTFNFMSSGLRERERIRSTFARYVSDQVAERILKEEDELDLAGELRQVTVLFLDIRGFTILSEHLHPRQVVALLNDYFEIIIEVIFKNEGTINKFIGDSIMAIYGAPQTIKHPELQGVKTAVDIQASIGKFNWQRMQDGKPVVNFGIGIHSGEAIAGNIGSALRMEYTVIGRDVNLAQRIESTTKEGQILISESTYKVVENLIEAQQKDPVRMKGIVDPIPLYEVLGLKAIESASNVQPSG